jgi:cyclic pyranopterin phosphate synthase
LYAKLTELVAGIAAIGPIGIKLTTNGSLLHRKAAALKHAGLQSVNVSLDAVEEAIFARMSRRQSLDAVITGIDSALAAGLDVKLNAVLMKGMNEDQVLPLLEFAHARGISIRFLEVMAMGHLYHQSTRYLLSQREILETIEKKYQLTAQERGGASFRDHRQ